MCACEVCGFEVGGRVCGCVCVFLGGRVRLWVSVCIGACVGACVGVCVCGGGGVRVWV